MEFGRFSVQRRAGWSHAWCICVCGGDGVRGWLPVGLFVCSLSFSALQELLREAFFGPWTAPWLGPCLSPRTERGRSRDALPSPRCLAREGRGKMVAVLQQASKSWLGSSLACSSAERSQGRSENSRALKAAGCALLCLSSSSSSSVARLGQAASPPPACTRGTELLRHGGAAFLPLLLLLQAAGRGVGRTCPELLPWKVQAGCWWHCSASPPPALTPRKGELSHVGGAAAGGGTAAAAAAAVKGAVSSCQTRAGFFLLVSAHLAVGRLCQA